MDPNTFGLAYLIGLFAAVALGSTIPVLPTGAAVSVAAVLAWHDNPALILIVVGVGAGAAYVGDLLTYAVLHVSGASLAQRIGWLRADRPADALARLRRRVEENEFRVVVLSRLVPAGRIPVLLAAALGGYPWRRYAIADILAVTLWSAVYAVIGLLGGSLFPEPWQGIVAAVAIVLLLAVTGTWWRRRKGGVLATSPVS